MSQKNLRKMNMKVKKPYDNLRYFWFILRIFGINTYNPGSHHKLFTKATIPPFMFLCITLALTLAVFSQIFLRKDEVYMILSSALVIGSSVMMYSSLFKRQGHLKISRNYATALSRRCKGIIFLYALIFIPVSKALIAPIFLVFFQENMLRFFTLYHFENKTVLNTVDSLVCMLDYWILFSMPWFLTYAFSALCYQWADVIASVREEVRKYGLKCFEDRSLAREARVLLRKCRYVWRGMSQMEATLSSFVFSMVLSQVVGMFMDIVYVLKYLKAEEIDVEVCLDFCIFVFNFCISVYMASRIPEEMDGLLSELQDLHENLMFREDPVDFGLLHKQLRVVMRKQPVVLTAGGWASMRKSLIMVTLGSVFTYAMVIFQSIPV